MARFVKLLLGNGDNGFTLVNVEKITEVRRATAKKSRVYLGAEDSFEVYHSFDEMCAVLSGGEQSTYKTTGKRAIHYSNG